jgi:hypothetical protein
MQYPLMHIGMPESGAYTVAKRDALIMSDDHSSRALRTRDRSSQTHTSSVNIRVIAGMTPFSTTFNRISSHRS